MNDKRKSQHRWTFVEEQIHSPGRCRLPFHQEHEMIWWNRKHRITQKSRQLEFVHPCLHYCTIWKRGFSIWTSRGWMDATRWSRADLLTFQFRWRHTWEVPGTQSLLSLPLSNMAATWVVRHFISGGFRSFVTSSTRMASEIETNIILHRISNELRAHDLQNLKHLCHGRIPLGELEKAKTSNDLFRIMQQKLLIRPGNLNFLESLLKQVGRADLAGKIQISGGDVTMQTESALPSNPSEAGASYRGFLMKLSDELTRDNVESMKFVANLPGMYLCT